MSAAPARLDSVTDEDFETSELRISYHESSNVTAAAVTIQAGTENKNPKHRRVAGKTTNDPNKHENASPGRYDNPVVADAWRAINQVEEEVYSETEEEERTIPIGALSTDEYFRRVERTRKRNGEPKPELWDGTDDNKKNWLDRIEKLKRVWRNAARAAAKATMEVEVKAAATDREGLL
jgi:hypothetical protein